MECDDMLRQDAINADVRKAMESVFPFSEMDQIVVRNFDTGWAPAFFKRLELEFHEDRPFCTFEGWYEMIAPLPGNEDKIGSQDDAFGLYDLDSLKEIGLIDV